MKVLAISKDITFSSFSMIVSCLALLLGAILREVGCVEQHSSCLYEVRPKESSRTFKSAKLWVLHGYTGLGTLGLSFVCQRGWFPQPQRIGSHSK